MKLEGCGALVTGGAVRIGRAICEALAAEGCRVVIHCRRSVRQAESLAGRLRRDGAEAWVVRGDLSRQDGVQSVLEAAWREAGSLRILVNNAAVFHKHPLDSVTEENLLAEWRPNLMAPVLLTRFFAERIRRAPAGRPAAKVIHLLDRRVSGCETDAVPYLLTKKGLADFTRIAARALAPAITVNAVAPGAVLPPPRSPDTGKVRVADLAGRAPLRVRCTPRDVARAVVFLLREDTLTGQVIFVDAGQHLLAGATEKGGCP